MNKLDGLRALSAIVSRLAIAQGLGQSFGGDRDIYTALGYKKTLSFQDYWNKYDRQDVAARVVDAPVVASWRHAPEIHEKDKPDDGKATPFEEEWEDFQKEHKVYHYLTRADKLSGIGRFGVLLMGFDDGLELSEEILSGKRKLLYLRPYTEGNVTIDKWDIDPKSPRCGKPELYRIKISVNKDTSSTKDLIVHHSRVLHFVDNALEDDVYGKPRLKAIYNRLENIELIAGGSAEMFWRGAFPGMAFSADAETDLPDPGSTEANALQDEIDKYIHGIKREMMLQGMKVQELGTQVADPTNHLDAQLTLISVDTGIPKRILKGSERGELSSGQDSIVWNEKAHNRRIDYVEPWILRPFIDKMIEVGVITGPAGGYVVFWPDLQLPSDKERAEVAKVRTEAITKYASSPGADTFMPPEKFLKYIMEMDTEAIQDIIDAMDDVLAEEEEDQAEIERTAIEDQKRLDKEQAQVAKGVVK